MKKQKFLEIKRGLFKSLFFLFGVMIYSELLAEIVSINTSRDIVANAEYLEGDNENPLIIFVHGFLQTREFSTVNRLFTALNESDYPVLAPTLSLGVSNRKQALACESLHLHSLQLDTDEIRKWVEWGIAKGHNKIVLVGHSAGSVNISAYLAQSPNPVIEKTILISLTYFGANMPAAFETIEHAKKARAMILQGDDNLEKFALAFCKDYISTARDFLSYYEWSDQDVLAAIKPTVSKNSIIVGGNDNRINQKWIMSLKKASGRVIVIPGANHFFDQSHEFDLLETVESILHDD